MLQSVHCFRFFRQNPPKPFERDPSGSFFLDRDWWIFRHMLQFLRTGRLPTDAALLNELCARKKPMLPPFFHFGSDLFISQV